VPYRIKFEKKQGLFGRTPAKSWAMLAEYYDASLTLNAVAHELGRRPGLAYTPKVQHEDLYLNGKYRGIYSLIEQTQVNPGRVDIDDKEGWLVEFDYHDPSPLERSSGAYFTTSKYNLGTTIKSPEDLPSSSGYQFVKDDINNLVNLMDANSFPENGYRDLVNLESYAKYVLIQTLIDNFDFNSKTQAGGVPGSNYAYKDKGTKIFAGPLWDFDLSAGVEMGDGGFGGWGGGGNTSCSFPTHYCTYQDSIRPRHTFYRKFLEDPVYLAKWKKLWDKHLNDFKAIPAFIDSIAGAVEGSVVNNFNSYNVDAFMAPTKPTSIQEYKDEVAKLKTWWDNRLTFYGSELGKMNIDTSKDIPETSPSSSSRASSSSGTPSSSSRPSSSSVNAGTQTCDYQESLCGGIAFANVQDNTTIKPRAGECLFIGDFSGIQPTLNSTISINGEENACGNSWSSCPFNDKPPAIDGGYYVYIKSGSINDYQNNGWQNVVAKAKPNCSNITPIRLPQIAANNFAAQAQNGINLQAIDGATVEIYGFKGNLISRQNFSGGTYSVPLIHLPRGMYIVKVSFSGRGVLNTPNKPQILRIPVM
jgi:hypothetical protein